MGANPMKAVWIATMSILSISLAAWDEFAPKPEISLS